MSVTPASLAPPVGGLGPATAPAPGVRRAMLRELRERLERERAALAGAHQAGASGASVVRALADLMDGVVLDLVREAESRMSLPAVGWALVALGGYGRRELAPGSDVDLMLLFDPAAREPAEALARRLFQALWDLGLQLGHSTRTPGDCAEVAARDLATATSLLEGRLLAGDAALFARMEARLGGWIARRRTPLVRALIRELRRGYARHGSSLYRLEPNVKKSGGGLRTLQTLRWVGLVRHGTADLGVLHARGLLTAAEGRALREAQEFLWRVRNDLHFAAGRASDTVAFDDQLRLARRFGYEDDARSRGVERFMRRYYIHVTDVHEIVGRFVARTLGKPRWRRALDRALARRVEEIFALAPTEIGVVPGYRERLLADPLRIVGLFHLAQVHGRAIDHELLDQVRAALEVQDDAGFAVPPVAGRFRAILATPERLADTLTLMQRTGVLEKLVPEFREVSRLVQFNRYHRYTVDEHTLVAIRAAAALAGEPIRLRRGPKRAGPGGASVPQAASVEAEGTGWLDLGGADMPPGDRATGGAHLAKAYGEIRRKDLLHLALLLHDVGKGAPGDHSARGAAIAAAVGRRLGYDEHDTRLLAMLVREHLTMEQLAFRRDPGDEKVLLRLVRAAGNAEALRMLFVLTYADLVGVGPDSWTRWKEELLTALYTRAMDELTGSREMPAPAERLGRIRRDLFANLSARHPAAWLEAQWEAMGERYLLATPLETVERHVTWLAALPPGDVIVHAENQPATGTTEYTVLARQTVGPDLFARIAGVLAAKGLQILRAQVDTRGDGVAIQCFAGVDTFFAGPPPAERLAEVREAIHEVLLGRRTVEELFSRHRRFQPLTAAAPAEGPTQVEVDEDSSDAFTVVEVFAQDRQGLLYVIATALLDLGLAVHSAKVATRLDQVLDVFYVTERSGGPITDPERLEVVRRTLVERIERHVLAPTA